MELLTPSATAKEDFKHWEFAGAPARMKDLADFFGVFYENDGDRITHSLSTAIVGPDGKIEAWYPGMAGSLRNCLQL